MRLSYHRIAYEALEVCNAVDLDTVEATLRPTGLTAGRAFDIGCGNAGISVMLAERFGLAVTAVEYDPAMASLAASRVAAASLSANVNLIEGASATVLANGGLWDLIVAMGATDPVGGGTRDPATIMTLLLDRVKPSGWLLWGDLVWLSEPSPPLRQIIQLTGTYLDHDGWQTAARTAGFEVVSATVSSQQVWDGYTAAMDIAVRAWLAANPDHPDAASIQARADQLSMMMDFGRGMMGFGLYLLRRPET